MQIDKHVFIVTGAASGLGAAVVSRLVAGGAHVLLVDLNADAVAKRAAELGAAAQFASADVADEASAKAAVARAVTEFGAVHGLINCAGIALGERVLGREAPHDLERFHRVLRVNVLGTFNMIRLAAEAMANNPPAADGERGVIVNTSSVAAYDGQIGQAAYAASKGAVASMTLPIAREFSRVGIRVMAIAPGIFETPMMKGMSPEVQQSLGASVPFPARLGRPEEFAALVEHIIANSYLNGEVIRLDGAVRLAPR
jgi:NAD(P)-dependent dehydrogenase (short-subunit alcohol dehydrogenase family)